MQLQGLMMSRSAIITTMSTQNLEPEDSFDTKLITRLANEFYAEFKRAGGPVALPDNASSKQSNGLSRGYPGHVRPYAPGVHPDAPENAIDEALVSGTHSPGSQDSFVFGEPKEEGIRGLSAQKESINPVFNIGS